MIDYADLVKQLRGPIKHPQQLINASHEAADVIEYLMKKNGFFNDYCEKQLTRIAELEAALEPFAAYYSSDCNNLDPDYCVICEADEEENNLTVGLFRAAYKVLGEK